MICEQITCNVFIFGFLLNFVEAIPVDIPVNLKDIGNCGRVNSRASKILNGKDALPHEFSWLVSIKTRSKDIKDGKGSHFCAGFIIDSRHIITAGHCFIQKYNSHLQYSNLGLALPSSVSITLGQNDLSKLENDSENTTIENISIHPDFEKHGHLANDIAILTTSHDMNWEPICLPNGIDHDETFQVGDMVTVAGWGNTNCHNSKIRPSKTLKKVEIPIWKNSDCLQAYQDANYDFTRQDYVCAGDDKKDASKGDSGSALMLQDSENNQFTAIGIVSAGKFMCIDRVPGVYTKISSYVDWIKSQIKQYNF